MVNRCQFKRGIWKCYLDAEKENDFCYWHQEIKEKVPTQEKLDELKSTEILFVFLQEAKLKGANLQRADLQNANLRGADLSFAKMQEANLEGANLQKANCTSAIFTGSNMESTLFDTESRLDKSNLENANLNESFIDYAKSLRSATIFKEENLNEIEVNELKANEANDCENKRDHYLASQEIYNKLYHFYSDEGMDFRAKHAHYRRAEVTRKLLRVRYKWNTKEGMYDRIRSWGFDWLILKILIGHGESIVRPVAISLFWIIAFAFSFKLFDGVKVAGRNATTLDYLYLSTTTFTGLGFADVQPNVNVTVMQPLIMGESIMGISMVAIIIFVITYQISR